MVSFPSVVLDELRKHLEEDKKRTNDRIAQLSAQDPFSDPDRANDNAASDSEASEESSHDRFAAMVEELEKRLVVEDHAIDAGERRTGLPQAEVDGLPRKAGVVFLAGEALLLGGRHNFAIGDQGRRTIVVERRYSQNFHEGGIRAPSRPLKK